MEGHEILSPIRIRKVCGEHPLNTVATTWDATESSALPSVAGRRSFSPGERERTSGPWRTGKPAPTARRGRIVVHSCRTMKSSARHCHARAGRERSSPMQCRSSKSSARAKAGACWAGSVTRAVAHRAATRRPGDRDTTRAITAGAEAQAEALPASAVSTGCRRRSGWASVPISTPAPTPSSKACTASAGSRSTSLQSLPAAGHRRRERVRRPG